MTPPIQLNQKIAVSVVFVAAMFMAIMDITIVNVALPSIGRDFHETPRLSTRWSSASSSAWPSSSPQPAGWAIASA